MPQCVDCTRLIALCLIVWTLRVADWSFFFRVNCTSTAPICLTDAVPVRREHYQTSDCVFAQEQHHFDSHRTISMRRETLINSLDSLKKQDQKVKLRWAILSTWLNIFKDTAKNFDSSDSSTDMEMLQLFIASGKKCKWISAQHFKLFLSIFLWNLWEFFWLTKWNIKRSMAREYYMLMEESLWEPRLNSGRQRTHFIWECVLIQTQTLSLCDLWGKVNHVSPNPSRVSDGWKITDTD